MSVSISSPSSADSRDDGYVLLRIEDDASGECLTQVEIPAGRWWRLCQGATQHHDALVSPHLDRVGKRMENRRLTFGRDFGREEPPGDRDIYRAAMEQAPDFLDYEAASPRYSRDGWEVIIRRWVDTDGQA